MAAVAIAGRDPASPATFWVLLGGAGLLVVAFFLTRTALQRAEQERDEAAVGAESLQAQLEKHRRAIDGLADGLKSAIFVCDSKGLILYANARAREWFRFDDPGGRSILAVTISYDLEQIVVRAYAEEGPLEQELNLNYPEDRTMLARAWKEPAGDRVFVSLYDLTELRRLERIRQDFVANVSHELRTPLAAIRSLAETLHDEPKATLAKRTDYLNRIIAEVDRLATVVSDLLVLSTAESNPVRKQACDLAAVVKGAITLLRTKAEAKGLSLNVDLPKAFGIEANPAQMNQVVINLIDNAINYTPDGSVSICLEDDGPRVTLKVADTGIGIPSDELPRIFERFYRVDKGRSRATGGTGLGLSIVRHIVEAHGGTVDVESALNEGTTFTIRLPKSGA